MRLIDADHLISILKEYIKREDSYISICNNPTLAEGIKRGLQEAVRTVNKEPSAQTEHATCYLDSPCEYQNINIALPPAQTEQKYIDPCDMCQYNSLDWHEEPCESCTVGGEDNHWKG